jgi:uncharacterized membrane protein
MTRLRQRWDEMRASLWFVPALSVLGAIALAVALIEVDTLVNVELLRRWPRLFGAGAEGSRGMLVAIAGTVMTAVSVTFSLTIVALSQASSQYTPRILRNFMRHPTNQLALGVLTGTFAYCLVVLRTVRGGDEGQFVPSLAVLFSFALALLCIGVLIFFIHHTAVSIQATQIISAVSAETIAAIDHLFPDELGAEAGEEQQPTDDSLAGRDWWPVPATQTGYIQFVDSDALLHLAQEREVVLRMELGVGEFAITDTPLAYVAMSSAPDEETVRALNAVYTISRYRTVEQDAGFGVRQIVDIALKALSPGINDSTTAVTCIDYLTAILVRLAQRRIAATHRYADGQLRVIAVGPTFERLLNLVCAQIRENAAGNFAVLSRLLRCLEVVAATKPKPERRRALSAQLRLLNEVIERSIPSAHDRTLLDEDARRVAELTRFLPAQTTTEHHADCSTSQ